MKKLITLLLTSVTLFACAFGLSGCGNKRKEIDYFMCYEYEKYVEVVDLSEEGHKQKYIVMPETINGKPYSFTNSAGWGRISTHCSENNILEKIYFEYSSPHRWDSTASGLLYADGFFKDCTALKKIILNTESAKFSYNNNQYDDQLEIHYDMVRPYSKHGEYAPLYSNYSNIPVYVDEDGNKTKCYFYLSGGGKYVIPYVFSPYLANVEFMFNYDNAPNEGYYWIDDIDDGEKLEVLPPDPTREGYIFGGWYCEKECENQFDFDSTVKKEELIFLTDKIGKEVKTIYHYPIYTYPENYVTYIYAKWIKE